MNQILTRAAALAFLTVTTFSAMEFPLLAAEPAARSGMTAEPPSSFVPQSPLSGDFRVRTPVGDVSGQWGMSGEDAFSNGEIPGGWALSFPWLDFANRMAGLSMPAGATPIAPVPSGAAALGNMPPVAVRWATIVNPPGSGVLLTFSVENKVYRLPPGTFQRLQIVPNSAVQFDRGMNFGMARQPLSSGVHAFYWTANGWQLRSEAAGPRD